MHFTSTATAAAIALLAQTAICQTPVGISPAVAKNLGVRYGNVTVVPNVLLAESLVPNAPNVYLNQTVSGTSMVMLVDQSIPQISINSTGPEVQGLEPCRTTRLHWLQTGLKQMANGSFTSNSSAIADYGSPMPGLNDIAHTYVFWLFPQPANFTLPSWDAGRVYNPISVYARMNFSVEAIAQEVGMPIAASYIRVQNPNSTSYGTANNGTCPSALTNGSTTPAPYTGAASGYQSAWTSGTAAFVCGLAALMML